MSGGQHQPGDHVLVEAVYIGEVAPDVSWVIVNDEHGGEGCRVRAADVRPLIDDTAPGLYKRVMGQYVPAAPAPAPAPVDDERLALVVSVLDEVCALQGDYPVARRILAALDAHRAGTTP